MARPREATKGRSKPSIRPILALAAAAWAAGAAMAQSPSAPQPPAPGVRHEVGETPLPEFGPLALPAAELKASRRQRVCKILQSAAVVRKTPVERFPCDPEMLEWLLRHPVWTSHLWRELGIDVGEVAARADGYEAREGDTNRAVFEVVYDGPQLRVVYVAAESRQAPLPGKLAVEMVVLHRYRYGASGGAGTDRREVCQQVEAYVAAGGAASAALLSLGHGVAAEAVDRTIEELNVYFLVMARVLQLRSDWGKEALARLAPRMPAAEAAELGTLLGRMPPPRNIPLPRLDRATLPNAGAGRG